MQGKVEISGVNTAKLKTLKNDEMVRLMKLAKSGDEEARQALIEGNLRLVLSVIQRFVGRGENPDDLFQVGCIGLLKAIANFDETKEVRFSTYGVPMIAGEVRRYLRDNSAMRVSRSLRDTAYRVLQCKEAMMGENGREPSLEEVAKRMELPLEDVSRAMDAIAAPISLYDPVYSDGGDPLTVMDQVRDTKNPNGGGGPGGHLPGPGFSPGKKRHWYHPKKCDGNLASLEPFPTVGRYCEFAEHRGKPHDVSAGRTHGSAPTAGREDAQK